MKKILLSAGQKEPIRYMAAVRAAGGDGVKWKEGMSPSAFDGLILCGGGDPEPALFGEENKGSYAMDRERDRQDLWLIHQFLREQKPILGICRGHQLLNVAFGGSLIQHLPTAQMHLGSGEDLWHPLRTEGFLKKLYGRTLTANSCHHQGLSRLGRGLSPAAFAPDGVVEAIQHETLPLFGVQFHPERMAEGTRLFQWFLDTSKKEIPD